MVTVILVDKRKIREWKRVQERDRQRRWGGRARAMEMTLKIAHNSAMRWKAEKLREERFLERLFGQEVEESAPKVIKDTWLNEYDLTSAKGGKYDDYLNKALESIRGLLDSDHKVTIRLQEQSRWTGKDLVQILNESAIFFNRRDHTFVPVVIKATVRVLNKLGFRGAFIIQVSPLDLTIIQLSKQMTDFSPSLLHHESGCKSTEKCQISYSQATSNATLLFLTHPDDLKAALFDDKGFYLSLEAEKIYKEICDLPHVYVARLASGKWPYIGVSCQREDALSVVTLIISEHLLIKFSVL